MGPLTFSQQSVCVYEKQGGERSAGVSGGKNQYFISDDFFLCVSFTKGAIKAFYHILILRLFGSSVSD